LEFVHWAYEQMIKFRWQTGSSTGCRDCFPDSSLLGDTDWYRDTGETCRGTVPEL